MFQFDLNILRVLRHILLDTMDLQISNRQFRRKNKRLQFAIKLVKNSVLVQQLITRTDIKRRLSFHE